jgi:hypothetical protein
MRELSANQVLTLLFMSLDSEAAVSFQDINRFFDILIEVDKKNLKDSKHSLGINMPMKGNFDGKLFNEITEGSNAGKLELIKPSSPLTEEIIKEKLTKHFLSLVGNNKEFMNDCKETMKIYREEYNKNKIPEENTIKITNVTFLEKIKGLVKSK